MSGLYTLRKGTLADELIGHSCQIAFQQCSKNLSPLAIVQILDCFWIICINLFILS